MTNLTKAIYNCRDSIIPVNGDRSNEYIASILSKSEEIYLNENFSLLDSVEFGKITYIHPTEENGLITRNSFNLVGDQGDSSITYTISSSLVDMKRYLNNMGYGEEESDNIECKMLSQLKNSIIILRVNVLPDTLFHEVFPYFMAISHGNTLVFVDEDNMPNHRVAMTFYTKFYNLLMGKDLPAYLKYKVARMVSHGVRVLINPIEDWFRCGEIESVIYEKVKAVRVGSILPYITLSRYYMGSKENYNIVCRKTLLKESWEKKDISVNDITKVYEPISVLNQDSFVTRGADILKSLRDPNFVENSEYPTIVNKYEFMAKYNPLDRIYREGFLQVCMCLENIFYGNKRKVYMQDVLLFESGGEMWLSAIPREQTRVLCTKRVLYHSSGLTEPRLLKNTPVTFIPITDRYYSQDIDCTPLREDELSLIRECAYYELTRYLNYTEYMPIACCESILEEKVTPLKRDLLNHNFYFLESDYMSLNKHKFSCKIVETALDPLGVKSRYLKGDDSGVQRVVIPL